MVAKVGPNEPCPCGSGRKFKRCCTSVLGSPASAAPIADADETDPGTHTVDERIVSRILEFGRRRFGAEFDPVGAFERLVGSNPEDGQIMVPWAAYHYRIGGTTLLDHYLDAMQHRLSKKERSWLEGQRVARLSYWEVTGVVPDQSVSVRDVFSGDERVVLERLGTRGLKRWDVVLGRVADHAGASYFCGLRSRALPPAEGSDAAKMVRRILGIRRKVPPAEILCSPSGEAAMFLSWELELAKLDLRPALPEIRNTDGEAFVQTTDEYVFPARSRDEVAGLLAKLPGVEADPSEEADGGLHLTFTRPGNRRHANWENTILAHVEIRAEGLSVETNSKRRADGMRKLLGSACGTLLQHRSRTARTPAQMLAERKRSRELEPASAEELSAVREYKEEHYARWPDTPLAVLDGLTPRQAAKHRARRSELEVTLKQIERIESSVPVAGRFDVEALRRELGI